MSTKGFIILIVAIVIEVILIHFIVSIRRVDEESTTQVERLQEDIKKYQLQIEELKKQNEVKQIQIEKQVKSEVHNMTPDEISKGIIDELLIKEDTHVED